MDKQRKTLREWRAYHNLTIQEVAKRAGIYHNTYSSWEKNPKMVRVSDIPKLAKAFNCDMDQIIFFEENPKLNFCS